MRVRWVGHVEFMAEKRYVCKVFVGKPKERKPHGRPRSKWMIILK
jgi:hypothetical protein